MDLERLVSIVECNQERKVKCAIVVVALFPVVAVSVVGSGAAAGLS